MDEKRSVPDYSASEQPNTVFQRPVQGHAAAQKQPQNKPLQVDAAPRSEFRPVLQQHERQTQTQAVEGAPLSHAKVNRPDSDFTISVDQARDALAEAGLKRSKDTVQRYCRDSTLEARKLGMFSLFFIAPDSLDAFLAKMHLDAGASTDAHIDVQVHKDATGEKTQDPQQAAGEVMQVQADASSDAADPNASARGGREDDVQVHGSSREGDEVLRAKLGAAKDMIDRLTEEIEFLRDEVRQSRHQRGDVVDISKQMLNTLETMAVGRKLEAPNSQNPTVQAEVVRSTDQERKGSDTYAPSDAARSASGSV